MILLELHDSLTLGSGRGALVVDPAGDGERVESVPQGAENLAWRGLRAGLGREPADLDLALTKRIPVAAGLGGGSSDAAAALRLGRRVSDGDDAEVNLQTAARIGADVPFFASRAAAAFVTGVGERVEPLPDVPVRDVVLALPPFRLATAAVFAELRSSDWSQEEPERAAMPGRNDLAAAAFRLRPELADVFAAFRAVGADPRLTGSGSACFTLTDDADRARHVAAALESAGLRVIRTATRNRAAEIEQLNAERRGG